MSSNSFNTGEPIAYFLTWTTYGTWLPGDKRGWNRKRQFEHLPPNRLFHRSAQASMKEAQFILNRDDRQLVHQVIQAHCEIRAWELHATNARSNHVHVVVTSTGHLPKTVASQFKAWSTRELKKAHPHRNRFRTQGASCRWINQQNDLIKAIDYTLDFQDRNKSDAL